MKPVGLIVETILKKNNLWQGYLQHLLVEEWATIVGSNLAGFSDAKEVRNGVLIVVVQDSVWAYHLSLMKPEIIKKLNNYVSSRVVQDIHFIITGNEKHPCLQND